MLISTKFCAWNRVLAEQLLVMPFWSEIIRKNLKRLHNKGDHKQNNEKKTLRMGENICKK